MPPSAGFSKTLFSNGLRMSQMAQSLRRSLKLGIDSQLFHRKEFYTILLLLAYIPEFVSLLT